MPNSERDAAAAEAIRLWRYVPLKDFSRPKPSATETVRKGFLGLIDRLRGTREPEAKDFVQQSLHQLSDEVRDRVAPVPDWRDPVAALDEVLQDWLTSVTPKSQAQVVLGAPHSGTVDVLIHWATAHGLAIVEPPSAKEILEGGDSWCARFPVHQKKPVVIPQLERYYLRHHWGLGLIRQLIGTLLHRPSYCLIGCSSWAWAYLGRALGIDALFPQPWILDPLTGERLQIWFDQLASRHSGESFVFRQSDNGRFVIPPAAADIPDAPHLSDAADLTQEPAPFLTDLAAWSRGSPGVAWALWRHSLRKTQENGENAEQNRLHEQTTQKQTFWVTPWRQLKLPVATDFSHHSAWLVVHALLLHESLSAEHLVKLMPLSRFDVLQVLTQLETAGVLEQRPWGWQVTPLGYPSVRDVLFREGYLVDAL